LSTIAEITGSNSAAALMFGDADSAREILQSLRAKKNIVEACLYAADGKILATYRRQDKGQGLNHPPPQKEGTWFEPGAVVAIRKVRQGGDVQGTIFLKSDLSELHARMLRYIEIILGVIVLSGLIAYLLATFLQRTISEPILDLARTAFSVSTERDYSLRATKRSQDEIGFLFDRFNEMLNQIQERDTELQRTHDELEMASKKEPLNCKKKLPTAARLSIFSKNAPLS
jgi:methyl-accepting chemotaxis protein